MRFGGELGVTIRGRSPILLGVLALLLPVGIAAAATTPANTSIVVSTADDVVNGDTSSPSTLVADPGPDGISLREAILAADNAVAGAHVYVRFADALAAGTIQLTQAAPLRLTHAGLTIAGLTSGGQPAVTVVASPNWPACAIFLVEASQVTIRRIAFLGGGPAGVVAVLIRGGTGRGGSASDSPCLSTPGPSSVSDVDIDENTFTNLPGGGGGRVSITNGDATITDVRISDNTFTNTNGTDDGDAVFAQNWASNSSIESLTIEGNHFEGISFGIELQPGASGDPWIDSPASGDQIIGTRISRNVFDESWNPIWMGTLAFGDLASGNVMDGTVIDANIFNMGSRQNGVTLTAGAFNASGNSIDNTQIVDNLLVGDSPAISLSGGGENTASDNQVNGVVIANDTVVSNTTTPALWSGSTYGSGTGNTVTGLDVRNTIFWGPGWPFNGDVTTSNVQNSIATQPGFSGTNGNIAADPEFVNAAAGDYHLTASSPAIDAGTSVSAPVFDLDDRARVGLPDIGAYEFGATPRPRLSLDTEELGGSGAVTSAPSAIDCATECSAAFDQGADVSLSATADDGSRFLGWSGACSGTVDCQVTMGAAESVTATFAAQAAPPPLPHATSFSPAAGVAGTHVALVGTGLANATEVDFTGSSAPATIDSDTATKIVVEVPSDATVGPITVKNVAGPMTTAKSFSPLPKITLLDAYDGETGHAVVITGTNLTGASDVKFGTLHASLTPTSATEVDTTVPPGFSSGKVTVTTPAGSAVSTQTYSITKVTGFTPAAAPAGAILTINGQGLASTNSVDFVGHAAVTPISTTATSVRVVVPSDAIPGPLTLYTPNITGGRMTVASFKVVPTITSINPLDGKTGTLVTITGKNFFSNVGDSVKFGTVVQPLFNVISPTEIDTLVPAGFSSGNVTVTTPGGSAVSKDKFAVSKVTTVAPASAAEGTVITITGQGLGSATGVSFAGFPLSQALVGPATPTSIKVAVPTISVSVGALTVHLASGDITTPMVFKPLPKIDSLMPIVAQAGAVFSVSGSNFAPTGVPPVVKLGSTVLTPSLVFGGGFLMFAFPSNLVTGMLTITTPDGTVSAKVAVLPTIQSGPTPSEGAAGTPVSLTGLTFTGTTSVTFANGASAPFTLTGALGSTQTLTFKVPATAASGPITMTNAGGSTATVRDFTVDPHVTSFSPASGADGATVTLTGSGFGLNGDTRAIKVGSVPATSVTWVSPTSVKFVIPNGAPVNDKIHIAVGSGAVADSATNVHVTATIASFTPGSGPAGTSVEIDGSGFAPTSTVKFNSVAASSVTVDSATVIHATVPAGTTPGKITVSRPTSPTTLTSATNFDNTAAITNLSEASGHAGDDLVVTGTDLTGATTVTFAGGATATATSVTTSSFHVAIPAAAETGTITVHTPLGDAGSSDSLTIEPRIDSFTPSSGGNGSPIVITGSGFTGATKVTLDAISSSFSVDSATQITVTVPGNVGAGPIEVTTPAGTADSASDFTYIPPPNVDSFSPGSGAVGDQIVITGFTFTGATEVDFNGAPATVFTVDSNTQITATVPAGATTGVITVVTPAGSGHSSTDFVVN